MKKPEIGVLEYLNREFSNLFTSFLLFCQLLTQSTIEQLNYHDGNELRIAFG